MTFWNEPNNKSHWDLELDPEWQLYSEMTRIAASAVAEESPRLVRVLGGISPIDPSFISNLRNQGVLDALNVVAVHGFPLDWNHWNISEWPGKLAEISAISNLPVWVTEAGASSFGAEEVQEFGLIRTAELLMPVCQRIHRYSLFDLLRAWPATTRHRESEGSAYYRHFHMGLLREDGNPKLAARHFPRYAVAIGICQWFHFDDHRLDDAVRWLRQMGVTYIRTGLSWADSLRPGALKWFERQMSALDEFNITLTFGITPESEGIKPHHTSAPHCPERFAEFCLNMVRRYAI